MPSRRKRGGGWGTGPNSIAPGYLVNQPYTGAGTDCAGTPTRPGYMDYYSYDGLPGFRGGSRRRKRRRSKGGRYEVNPGAFLGDNAIGASSPSYVSSVPCEASRSSMHGGKRKARRRTYRRTRGGMQLNPAAYGSGSVQVGASSSAAYYAANAGYANDFTTLRNGASPGFTIQTPYEAGAFNQACLKTGGSRRSRSKKSRKR